MPKRAHLWAHLPLVACKKPWKVDWVANQRSIGRNWQRMLLVVSGVLVAFVVVGLVADEVWLLSEPGSTDAPIRQSPMIPSASRLWT